MNVLYLNLDRRPDRNQSILESLIRDCGVPREKIHRFAGYDAKTFTGHFEGIPPLLPKNPVKNEQTARAIVCNFMGHVRMWQFVVDKHLPIALISQDDVTFAPELFSGKVFQLPADFEVVWLGYMIGRGDRPVPLLKDSTKYALEVINDDVMTIPYDNRVTNPCSMCYFISQQGARNLLDALSKAPYIQETDWWMNKYLSDKGIHYMTRKAYATNRFELGSDIFTLKSRAKNTSGGRRRRP